MYSLASLPTSHITLMHRLNYATMQIGLAVGDTREQTMEAEFTKLQVWVSRYNSTHI